MPRRVTATVAAAATGLLIFVPVTAADAKPTRFANCTALNKKYPHGVAKKGAHDKVRGHTKPVTTFKVSTKIYNAQKKTLDRDKDGVACEKR